MLILCYDKNIGIAWLDKIIYFSASQEDAPGRSGVYRDCLQSIGIKAAIVIHGGSMHAKTKIKSADLGPPNLLNASKGVLGPAEAMHDHLLLLWASEHSVNILK